MEVFEDLGTKTTLFHHSHGHALLQQTNNSGRALNEAAGFIQEETSLGAEVESTVGGDGIVTAPLSVANAKLAFKQ